MNEWCFIFSIFVWCDFVNSRIHRPLFCFFVHPLSSFVNRTTSTMTMTRMGSMTTQGRQSGRR